MRLMILSSLGAVATMLLLSSFASAVPYLTDYEVFFPESTGVAHGLFLPDGDQDNAKSVNQVGTNLYGSTYPQVVFTSTFNGSTYSGSDDYPPDNASIQEVYVSAIILNSWTNYHNPYPRTCKLAYYVGTDFGTASAVMLGDPNYQSDSFTINGNYWREIDWRITDKYDWTPGIMKSNSSLTLWVSVISNEPGQEVNILKVDYVGLRYNYTLTESTPPTEENPSSFAGLSFLSIGGLFGLFGLLGMIATPAMAVWFFRRDGGSKIVIAVNAMIIFVFCFALFLGSMGI